jgi:hypothetical protein
VSNQYDGGQAFPHGDETHGGCDGMTLRDYFAAAAIQGLMPNNDISYEKGAEMAYRQADAMLAERMKGRD